MAVLKLEPGQVFGAGYHEWAFHPQDAWIILERGYVVLNGVKLAAKQVDSLGPYPLIRVTGLAAYGPESDPQCPALDKVGSRQVEDGPWRLRRAA